MTATTTMAALTYSCSDCLSETRIVHLEDNIHVVQIFHDDTCPTLTRIGAEND